MSRERRRWFSLHTTEEVLVDLLAVVLGDKPVPLLVDLSERIVRTRIHTLSRVPVASRGIALTTPENNG